MEKHDFHAAAREGTFNLLAVELLTLENLSRQNSSGNTPLHMAAKYGRFNQLPVELLNQYSLSLKNSAGYTPIHLAARSGHLAQIPRELLTRDNLAAPLQQRLYATSSSRRRWSP